MNSEYEAKVEQARQAIRNNQCLADNTRAKGASAERELAKKLTELGYSDAMMKSWCTQAERDAGELNMPIIIHRWNGNTQWWVYVWRNIPNRRPYWQKLEDFLEEWLK